MRFNLIVWGLDALCGFTNASPNEYMICVYPRCLVFKIVSALNAHWVNADWIQDEPTFSNEAAYTVSPGSVNP